MQSNRLLVSKNSEFFTAICKKDGGDHTFVLVGIRDKDTKINHVLFGVGKYFAYGEQSHLDFVLNHVRGSVRNEFRAKDERNQRWQNNITYQAHSIRRQQYLAFIEYMKHIAGLQNSNHFFWQKKETGVFKEGFLGFKLTGETDDDLIFDFTDFSSEPSSQTPNQDDYIKIDNISRSVGVVSRANSCRHSAKTIFNSAVDGKAVLDIISDHYSDDLPYESVIIKYNQLKDNLFIFPLPPSPLPDDKNNERYKVMVRIYQQMQKLSRKYHDNKATYEKFDALKALYVQLDMRPEADIHSVFRVIVEWDKTNKPLIDTQRAFNFFNTTATRDMLDEFYKMQANTKLSTKKPLRREHEMQDLGRSTRRSVFSR